MSVTDLHHRPEALIKQYWGYDHFRPLQREIITHVLEERDAVALLPTGGGKSLCYQVPALMREGMCLVISPLIALMKDQVEGLKKRGIAAEAIYAGLPARAVDRILDNCIYGNVKLLYLSPERLQSDLAGERIKRMQVSLVAVDEAHCISQWGHDFRPAYRLLSVVREWHPGTPILALTASATKAVAEDIARQLLLRDHTLFQGGFKRDNLSYLVYQVENKMGRLLEIMRGVKGTKLVYVRSRSKARELAEVLSKSGVIAEPYHAGMGHVQRSNAQARWLAGTTPVIVSTTAFGMGIDKPDVRAVVHYDLPASPEEYYQEAGRAGRDGNEAYCVTLYHTADRRTLTDRWEKSHPTIEEVRRVYRALMSYLRLPIGGGKGTVHGLRMSEFTGTFDLNAANTYHALKLLERTGWIILNEAFHHPARVQFLLAKTELYNYQLESPEADILIKALLRSYEGMFLESVAIDVFKISRMLKRDSANVTELLHTLHRDQVIRYTPATDDPQIVVIRERVSDDNLGMEYENVAVLREAAEQRLQGMLAYIDAVVCREQTLLSYFGEAPSEPCGKCDLCRARKASPGTNVIGYIPLEGVALKSLLAQFRPSDAPSIKEQLEQLESEGMIEFRDDLIFPIQRPRA